MTAFTAQKAALFQEKIVDVIFVVVVVVVFFVVVVVVVVAAAVVVAVVVVVVVVAVAVAVVVDDIVVAADSKSVCLFLLAAPLGIGFPHEESPPPPVFLEVAWGLWWMIVVGWFGSVHGSEDEVY